MSGAFGAGLIGTLAVIMIVSAVAVVVFRRLHQPAVLGYLIAGMAVGPGSNLLPTGISPTEIAEFADLGVIFVLLFIGMEFDLRQLRAIGAPAILIGGFEVAAMMAVGFALGTSLGFAYLDSIYLGALIAISSTAVTIKILADLRLLEDKATRLVVGILVIEDFAAVILLSALSGTSAAISPQQVATVILFVIAFFFGTVFVGMMVVPRVFHRLERLASDEVLTIAALGLCFTVALVAVVLGFSPAMGAFLAGVLLGESGVLDSIKPRFEPIRDLFAAIFFVSVGMLIVPSTFVQVFDVIVVVTLVFIAGKVAATGGITFLLGYGGRDALAVGTRMARTGEFSFIIGNVGIQTQRMNPVLYSVIAGVTLVTTFIGATLVRRTPQIYRAVAGVLPAAVDQTGAAYTAWVSRARNSSKRDPVMRGKFRQNGIRIFLTTVFILIVSYTAVAVIGYADPIASSLRTTPEFVITGALGAAVLVIAGPAYVMFRLAKQLVDLTVAAATEGSAAGRLAGRTAVSSIVGGVLFLGIVGLLMVGLLPLISIATDRVNIPLLVVGLFLSFAAMGVRIFRSARALHERFENVFTEGMGEAPSPVEDGSPVVQKLSNLPRYLWAFGETETIAEYVVPESSPLAGGTLGDLRIRGRTGARIVAVQHGTHLQTAPSPPTRLHEGDLLILVGTISDLERFEVLLGRSADMEIQESSPT